MSRLIGLPRECLFEVAAHLPPASFCDLRLACSDLAALDLTAELCARTWRVRPSEADARETYISRYRAFRGICAARLGPARTDWVQITGPRTAEYLGNGTDAFVDRCGPPRLRCTLCAAFFSGGALVFIVAASLVIPVVPPALFCPPPCLSLVLTACMRSSVGVATTELPLPPWPFGGGPPRSDAAEAALSAVPAAAEAPLSTSAAQAVLQPPSSAPASEQCSASLPAASALAAHPPPLPPPVLEVSYYEVTVRDEGCAPAPRALVPVRCRGLCALASAKASASA